MYLIIEMFCDSENLPSLVDTLESQFKSRSARRDVQGHMSVQVIVVSHAMQSRKLFRTVMSKK